MKTSISKLAISLIVLLLVSVVILLFSAPKSLLIDRFLMDRDIYIFPTKVKENLLDVGFENLKVFYRDRKLGEFSRVKMGLVPTGIKLSAVCGGGSIKAFFNLSNLKIDLRSADCLENVGDVSGKLELIEKGIKGNLVAKDLLVRGLKIDSLKLTFKGSKFEGEIEYMGMKLVGGGSFKLDLRNIENSDISGEFKGSVGTLTVKGKLKNITAQLR